MIHHGLVAEDAAESANIFTGESCIHFTVFAKLAVHKIKFAFDADDLEAIRLQLHKYIASYITLTAFEEGFNVAHYRIQNLAFMQPVAIELSQLVFPVELPFGEHMFFECMVCLENYHGSCGFKTHAALDANDGIAYVNVATQAIRTGNLLQVLDGFGRVAEALTIYFAQFSFFKMQGYFFAACAGDLGGPGFFGQYTF